MGQINQYFLCGVGGSGMLPLALILKGAGHDVGGSDRALDQGRTEAKFEYLRRAGVKLYPQDGTGLTNNRQILVASAAVEDTVSDVVAARRLGAVRVSRAEILAERFNAAETGIGVAGTSGKSTTTAMIAWILHVAGKNPTVMNGAVMKNFVSAEALFASALVGQQGLFVSEIDESDGSIALFNPRIAVLNNISLDHKSMDELRQLFGNFVLKAETAVLNLDNPETALLAQLLPADGAVTYSLSKPTADLAAEGIAPARYGVSFTVINRASDETAALQLKMPGRHNVSNALAAIAAVQAAGVTLGEASSALEDFAGVKRRLESIGEATGVAIIDDFGHNPDKIAASLKTLHEFDGRLLIMFQPHGFGPLRKLKNEFITCFADHMAADDMLFMPDPAYFGGTTDRTVTSKDIVDGAIAEGRNARACATRDECGDAILEIVKSGDRVVIMGARDDTLSQFAGDILKRITDRT